MLKQRLLTAAILIPLTLAVLVYLPKEAFLALTSMVALIAAWEWTYLMQIRHWILRIVYLILIFDAFVGSMFIPIFPLLLVSFIWWLLALILLLLYANNIQGWSTQRWLLGLMGFILLIPCWIAINFIRNEPNGLAALLYLFAMVWVADSAAYFTGKRWGTIKFAKSISPQKSIQGLIGALFATVIFALVTAWICNIDTDAWGWFILLSILTVLFSIIGDLFESMIKRTANLKDSGTIFPGHGGLLDRIDSFCAAAPMYVLGAFLMKIYLG